MHYACSYVCQARAQLKCTQGQFSIVLCSSKLVDWTVAEPRSIACIHDCFHQPHQRFSIRDGNKNMPLPWLAAGIFPGCWWLKGDSKCCRLPWNDRFRLWCVLADRSTEYRIALDCFHRSVLAQPGDGSYCAIVAKFQFRCWSKTFCFCFPKFCPVESSTDRF